MEQSNFRFASFACNLNKPKTNWFPHVFGNILCLCSITARKLFVGGNYNSEYAKFCLLTNANWVVNYANSIAPLNF